MTTSKKKKSVKIIIKSILFVLILIIVFSYLSWIHTRKGSYQKLSPFFYNAKETDVLFLGISHMQVGVSPMLLWNEYGITSFNFGESGCRIPYSYWVLRNALQFCKPEVVVIDVRRMDIADLEMMGYTSVVFDDFPMTREKVFAALDLNESWQERIEFILPFMKYHSRWKELNKEDFSFQPDTRVDMGSYHYENKRLKIASPVSYRKVAENETLPLGEIAEDYLRRTIELCISNNIQVILTELPYCADEESQKYANAIAKIAEEYDVKYINFLNIDDVVNYDVDMADTDGHLNDSGMEKVSRYIGKVLSSEYNTKDHREESGYDFWNHRYVEFLNFQTKRIKSQNSLDTYLMLLNNNYTCSALYIPDKQLKMLDDRMKKMIFNYSEEVVIRKDFETGSDYRYGYLLITDIGGGIIYHGGVPETEMKLKSDLFGDVTVCENKNGCLDIVFFNNEENYTLEIDMLSDTDNITSVFKVMNNKEIYKMVFTHKNDINDTPYYAGM